MTSPLLLDQLAATRRTELLASATAHRSAHATGAARPGPSLAGVRSALSRLAPRSAQSPVAVCCA